MSKSEIAKDRLNLISNTLAKFDKDVKVEEVVGTGSNTLNENTLLLHVLLEVICRKCEPDAQKRQRLFRKMLKTITNAPMADQHVNLEALNSVRFVLATEFEKELMRESLQIQTSSLQNHLSDPEIKSNGKAEENYKYLMEFKEISIIGRGGFGTVWKAMHIIDGITYAVKMIKFKYKSDSDYEKVIREVKSFATLNHLNVVGYNQAWFETKCASASSDSAEGETSNSSSPSKDSSRLDSQKYSKGSKSGISKSSTSYNRTNNSESFKRYTFSEKSDDECVTFIRDTLSNGSYGDISRRTAKRTHFNLSSAQTFSSDADVIFDANYSNSDSSNRKNKSNSYSRKSGSRISKLQTVNAMLYIQMEYCDGVLKDWLDEREKGNSTAFQLTVAEIFRDILNGVAHIHSKSIIHRDLKPQNIFYSAANNTMKIGDFGLATLSNTLKETGEISMEHSSGCGTIPYAAPEQRSKRKYDSKVDMYSLGVILIELLIDAKTRMEFSNAIKNVLQTKIPEKLTKDWPEYVYLVKNLVQMDPEQRLSAKEVLSQPPIYSNIAVELRLEVKELKEALEKKDLDISEKQLELRKKQLDLEQREKELELKEKNLELREKDKRIKQLEALLHQQNLMQDKYS